MERIISGLILAFIYSFIHILIKCLDEKISIKELIQKFTLKKFLIFLLANAVAFGIGTFRQEIVEAIAQPISNNKGYFSEIDSGFNREYTLSEKKNCKNIILSSLEDEENKLKEYDDNYSGVTPSKSEPNNIEDFKLTLEYWEGRCKNSNNPVCYREYANVSCDFIIYLYNLNDYNNNKKYIKKYSKICMVNYRRYLMFDTVNDANRSDALYRIGQLTETLSMIKEKSEKYRNKMLFLSSIYFELAYDYADKSSVYYASVPFYLAKSYENIAPLAQSKETIDWLVLANERYIESYERGYLKSDCKDRQKNIQKLLDDYNDIYKDEIAQTKKHSTKESN